MINESETQQLARFNEKWHNQLEAFKKPMLHQAFSG